MSSNTSKTANNHFKCHNKLGKHKKTKQLQTYKKLSSILTINISFSSNN